MNRVWGMIGQEVDERELGKAGMGKGEVMEVTRNYGYHKGNHE
jgi:hypothetical protein